MTARTLKYSHTRVCPANEDSQPSIRCKKEDTKPSINEPPMQEVAEEAAHAHRVRKMSKAQKNRQLVRDHLKSTIPQTQAAEAADAHMQDNYIQPASHDIRNEPEPPSPK